MNIQLSIMLALTSGLACVLGVCGVVFALVAGLQLLVLNMWVLMDMLCSVGGGVCVCPLQLFSLAYMFSSIAELQV